MRPAMPNSAISSAESLRQATRTPSCCALGAIASAAGKLGRSIHGWTVRADRRGGVFGRRGTLRDRQHQRAMLRPGGSKRRAQIRRENGQLEQGAGVAMSAGMMHPMGAAPTAGLAAESGVASGPPGRVDAAHGVYNAHTAAPRSVTYDPHVGAGTAQVSGAYPSAAAPRSATYDPYMSVPAAPGVAPAVHAPAAGGLHAMEQVAGAGHPAYSPSAVPYAAAHDVVPAGHASSKEAYVPDVQMQQAMTAATTPLSISAPAAQQRSNAADRASRLGSHTHETEFAAARRRQRERLLRSGERERVDAMLASHRMEPRPSRDVAAYVEAGDEPKFRVLHAVLRKLKTEWGFLLDPEFNPVALSLALLPGGSLIAYKDAFSQLATLIEQSLQGTLDDHYDSFAKAITVNHGMIAALGESQDGIAAMRTQLLVARDALGTRRADLIQMWQRMQHVKEAMRVLSLLEQLRSVPDELETLLSEKQFLQATRLLMRSLRQIQRDDLVELGATADLRAYLRSQEHSLLEILIEELQNHLYLKSYWCDVRWRAYVPGQDALPGDHAALGQFLGAVHAHLEEVVRGVGDEDDDAVERARGDEDEDGTPSDAPAGDAPHENPEADSFAFLEGLLASLAHLGKIGYALDTLAQLVPVEVHQLVDATIDEVDARHEPQRYGAPMHAESVFFAPALTHSVLDDKPRRSFSLSGTPIDAPGARGAAPELAVLQRDMDTLRDFFWTLFSKLDAVLQAHRAVQEVAAVLMARADPNDGGAADRASAEVGIPALARVWHAVCHEVRSLLQDYLSEDTAATSGSGATHAAPPVDALLRARSYERDRSHPIFRLSDAVPRRPSPAVRAGQDSVSAALRSCVPGLVHEAGTYVHEALPMQRDEYMGTGHRLLVRPLVFTVSVLFQPTLAFIDRVASILPADVAGDAQQGFGGFLREFTSDHFFPMLAERVQALVGKTGAAPDAFVTEPAARARTPRPVVRSASQVVALVDSLYSMLQAAPFYRDTHARLIVLAFVEYYTRCNDHFKGAFHARDTDAGLVAEDEDALGGPYVLSAVWAQRPDMYACLQSTFAGLRGEAAQIDLPTLRHTEAELECSLHETAAPAALRRADLLTSRKRHMALGTLQHSLHWLETHFARLRVTEPSAPMRDFGDGSLALPLGGDAVPVFESVPRMYRTLGSTVLMTLHVEARLKTLYYLDLAVREGTFLVDPRALEPEAYVIELNAELAASHESYKETMLPEHVHYVFDGLDVLMDAVMSRAVTRVSAVNRAGVTKMLRNILSLQQNLKNILDAPLRVDLDRSKRLWEMVSREPEVRACLRSHTAMDRESACPAGGVLGAGAARRAAPLPRHRARRRRQACVRCARRHDARGRLAAALPQLRYVSCARH